MNLIWKLYLLVWNIYWITKNNKQDKILLESLNLSFVTVSIIIIIISVAHVCCCYTLDLNRVWFLKEWDRRKNIVCWKFVTAFDRPVKYAFNRFAEFCLNLFFFRRYFHQKCFFFESYLLRTHFVQKQIFLKIYLIDYLTL